MKNYKTEIIEENAETQIINNKKDRRSFLKKSIIGGISLAGFLTLSFEDTIAHVTSKVSRHSLPSDLKITDLRYVSVMNMGSPKTIIRIYTNQDIYGLGEVRNGADKRYALMLKSKLVGQNPANIEKIFKSLKLFGGDVRHGAGVSGVEIALWDLMGKAYEVPCWALLGGKYRDKIRLYADTFADRDIEKIKAKVKHRVQEEGFTWLKETRLFNLAKGSDIAYYSESLSKQLTNEGIEAIVNYISSIRSLVGNEVEISTDHFGSSNLSSMIRLGKALDPYRLAWMEDPVPYQQPHLLKALADSIDTPICTGEDIYLKETFMNLCDLNAIDMVHPDLNAAGGILETKKIGDYAQDKGVGMAMHFGGTPISFMANVHCAASTENFSALEFHPEGEQIPKWTNMVKTTGKLPLITRGFANVPEDSHGLGVELNEVEIKKNLNPKDSGYFLPTTDWNEWRGG